MLQVSAHELSHDTETTDLNLDLPILDIIFQVTYKHAATLAFDNRASAEVALEGGFTPIYLGKNGRAQARGTCIPVLFIQLVAKLEEAKEVLLLRQTNLIELDSVKSADVKPEEEYSSCRRDSCKKNPDDELHPPIFKRDEVVFHGTIIEQDAPGQIRRLWTKIVDIGNSALEGDRTKTVKHCVVVDVP